MHYNHCYNIILFLLLILQYTSIFSKPIEQHGDLKVKGNFQSDKVSVQSNQELNTDKLDIAELQLKQLQAKAINGNILITDKLKTKSQDGNLYINAKLNIKGEVLFKQQSGQSSFIELDNIYIDGVKQWKPIKYYSQTSLQELNEKLNKDICEFKAKEAEIKLNLVSEDKANHYRIEMLFEFIHKYWNNNRVYIKYKDEYYWNDNHNWEDQVNAEDTSFWQTPVSFIIPGRLIEDDKIALTIGFKLEHIDKDICSKVKYAFKFSDLNISIK